MLIPLFQWYSFELDMAVLISLFVLVVSDVVVLVYLYSQFIMARRAMSGQQHIHLRGKDVRKRLLAVSIPTTGLRIFHAVVNAIEPFLVKERFWRRALPEQRRSINTECWPEWL